MSGRVDGLEGGRLRLVSPLGRGGILSIDQRPSTNNTQTDVRANLKITTNNATLGVFSSTQGYGVLNINPSANDAITRIVKTEQIADPLLPADAYLRRE